MAKRNTPKTPRRGSSRKRAARPRPAAPEAAVPSGAADPSSKPPSPRRAPRERRAPYRDPLSVGERPHSPWHPLPLSEALILVGAIGTIVGLKRLGHGGISNGGAPLFAGLGAVIIGTAEVTLREHLSGYRSHALLLALLPTIVFHSAVVLSLAAFTAVPRWVNIPLLALDGALLTFLFKTLRARFLDARRERVFAAGGRR